MVRVAESALAESGTAVVTSGALWEAIDPQARAHDGQERHTSHGLLGIARKNIRAR